MEKAKLREAGDYERLQYGGVAPISTPVEKESVAAGAECSLHELQDLVQVHGKEALDKLEHDYGGIQNLCQRLRTCPNRGLNENDAYDMARRKSKYGSNFIQPKGTKMFLFFLWEALQDLTLVILMVAAVVSIALSFYHGSDEDGDPTESRAGYIEGIGIFIAVVIIVFVTAGINCSKDAQFRGLQSRLGDQFRCSTIRSGNVVDIPVAEILVGDICLVKYGDVIPADGYVISSNDLKVDESSHTGESEEVLKGAHSDPILYSGTHVMEGSAKMVALCVGENSQKGIIFTLLGVTYNDENEPEEKKSLLHGKLNSIALYISYAGTALAALTFIILVIRFCIETFAIQKNAWDSSYIQQFVSFLIISITLLVVAVPEGLPLAVILALAYSIKRMMADNNLVRHLDACETMGSATIICSDKTGTLTTNKMTVAESYVGGLFTSDATKLSNLSDQIRYLVSCCIAYNTGYTSLITFDGYGQVGNKTECALLGFVPSFGYDYKQLRALVPEEKFHKIYTFNSQRKWMGTVISTEDEAKKTGKRFRLFAKGAPEIILERCGWMQDADMEPKRMTDEVRNHILHQVVEVMASRGLRTICLAYKDFVQSENQPKVYEETIESNLDWDKEDLVTSNLVCLAIVGIEDPVRQEVPEAIKKCQQAGITVCMVTGDNLLTAKFVANKCGILDPSEDYLAITGKDFNKMIQQSGDKFDQQMFDLVWPRLRVLARASPQDKYNLVRGLMASTVRSNRQVVAVTGDGTNDGPALKKAHVGLCMGISGTDVAKEASDIILIDDNFTSIVKSVVWGRHVYDSIAKFLQFQLTVNAVAVMITLLGACIIMDSPLKGVQMLWVNLLMDTLASLSLATEKPADNLLDRKPYGSTKSLVSPIMLVNILSHATYELIVLLALLFVGDDLINVDSGYSRLGRGEPNVHYTFLFNTFVMMILFNEINSRKIDGCQNVFSGIQHSPLFVFIWLASFIVQVIIVQFGGDVFFTTPLSLDEWFWSLLFGIGELLVAEFVSYCVTKQTCACIAWLTPTPTDDKQNLFTTTESYDSFELTENDKLSLVSKDR